MHQVAPLVARPVEIIDGMLSAVKRLHKDAVVFPWILGENRLSDLGKDRERLSQLLSAEFYAQVLLLDAELEAATQKAMLGQHYVSRGSRLFDETSALISREFVRARAAEQAFFARLEI